MAKFVLLIVALTLKYSASALVGGWEPADPKTDAGLQKLIQPVEEQLNQRSNSLLYEKIVKVTDAEKQVVEGMRYKLTYISGRTNCNKNKMETVQLDDCQVLDERECTVVVWTRPWLHSLVVSPEKCEDFHEKRHARNCEKISSDRKSFEAFKAYHGKLYESREEEELRYDIFRENMAKAQAIQDNEQGTACYGATKFADLTPKEFKKHLGLRPELGDGLSMKPAKIPEADPPTAFDWRDHNAVTPVKNQGSCGSCWAFSTTGNIEGQWSIKKKSLVSLSEQELVDCDKVDQGCEGGLPSQAYKEIERLGGLEGEADYKYRGVDEKCEFSKSKVKVYINSSVSISKDETEMAKWLAQNGPISIGINANVMQFYFGGISHPWKIFCNPKSLDHGVLIVGYGVQSGKPYWIIKNSWGPSWGEKGYYLAYRGDGVCGLNQMCTSSVIN